MREAQKEAEEARARAEVAERALESERAARAGEIKAAESRAEAEADRLRVVLNDLMVAEDASAAKDLHISELTAALRAKESQAGEAEERARAAEERANAAEERAKAAEERADKFKEDTSRAQEAEGVAVAALAAEVGARTVEVEAAVGARIARAIEEFKASESFSDELAEASAEAFLQGFQHGKEKVARDLNFPQALEVEPERLSEVASSDDEPAPAEP